MSPRNWTSNKATVEQVTAKLRNLLETDAPFIESVHFKQRMQERQFSLLDVLNVLERGKIEREPKQNEQGHWGYRVDTKKMYVVISFNSDATAINLVTAQWIKEGRKL